jgi:chromosome segregation ATPase
MRRTVPNQLPANLDIDDIIEKYKRGVSEQTSKMSELKRSMLDYDRSLHHTAEISTGKATKRHAAVQDAKDRLIQSLQEELAGLRARRGEGDLKEDLRSAQEKVKELTQANTRLQEQLKGVRHEVRTLRKPSIDPRPLVSPNSEPRQLIKDLQSMSRELSQLVHLTRSLKSGEELDMKYLIGGNQYETYPEDVERLMQVMRKDLNEVRSEVGNLYAEHCGSKCAPQ